MIIYALLFLLLVSFFSHIASIIFYILNKSTRIFNFFVSTLISNMCLSMVLIVFALRNPEMIRSLNMRLILWVLSGIIMIITLFIQIAVFRNVFRRSRDPEFYHFNYFGKKVYEDGIIRKSEFFSFVISLPFLLIIGAYFVARLINIFIYGHI
ncbi:MAG: hypothetical protein JXA20_18955 [Spirochaetes bacterium]|nr:hypothetical protein [Spirochaetota bacterium]